MTAKARLKESGVKLELEIDNTFDYISYLKLWKTLEILYSVIWTET